MAGKQNLGKLGNPKHPLQCKMFASKYYFEQEIKFSYLVWNIKNYERMKQGVCYEKTSKTTGWYLRLLKTEDDIRLLIHCNDASIEEIMCYISPSWRDDIFSIPYEVKRTTANIFELRILRSSVRDPKTNSDPGILGLYCRYNMMENCWKSPSASQGIDDEEKKLFTDELADMLDSGKYSDCTIRTPSKQFNVHKIILASRSEVLRKHFVEDSRDELTLTCDVSPVVMELLLRYIYSGKLDLRKMNEDLVYEVLKLATDWKIELLELRCVSFLRFTCNLDIKTIRQVAKERNACLSEKTKRFLQYVKA